VTGRAARAAALAALVAALVLSAVGLGPASAGTATPAASCAGKGDVTFRAPDRTRLVGHRFGRGKTAVVLAHQSRADFCQWVSYARRLARLGYTAFVFDFRNNGRSQQVGYARAGRLAGDVAGAVRYVRAHGAKKVFLVGASMGGTAVLAAAANVKPAVAGVVSLSGPGSSGGVDADAAVPRLRVPVLYVVAEEDAGGAFAADARALYDRTASTDKAIEVLPGFSHGVSLVAFAGPARNLLEQFLRR
jgi:alpha-beta hydrolase superfamily lysophospholipase